MSLSVLPLPWRRFCTSSARMKRAGPLQKLLHLANAREALASGDLQQALSEVDAAIAGDPAFGVARTLQAEIVARMNAGVAREESPAIVIAAPMPAALVSSPTVAITPSVPVRAPSIAAKPPSRRRPPTAKTTGIPIALGVLVIVGGVGVALIASGLMFRESTAAPARVVGAPMPAPARAFDVVLPPSPRAAAAPTPVPPAVADASETPRANAIEWASSRLTHLNVRPRSRASALHVEDVALLRDLGQGIGELWVGKLTGNEDVVFVGGSIDDHDWMTLRGSIKPTGVVWRIYSNRSASADAPENAALAAGFSRVKKVRYSADYSAEQFALRRSAR